MVGANSPHVDTQDYSLCDFDPVPAWLAQKTQAHAHTLLKTHTYTNILSLSPEISAFIKANILA